MHRGIAGEAHRLVCRMIRDWARKDTKKQEKASDLSLPAVPIQAVAIR